jgi:hypothetical protein
MPGIVFFVCLAVAGFTAAFLGGYLLRFLRLQRELQDLRSALSGVSAPLEPWATQKEHDQIVTLLARAGQTVSPLAQGAERVRQSRLPIEGSHIVLKSPVSKLIGGEAALDSWTGRALANALPGWLTAIGLMTTFLALLLGLQDVRVLSNLEVQGIGGLINGLSGKFFSSITALGCAIVVSMVNHGVSSRIDEQWRSLLGVLDGLLPHLNSEALLLEMLRTSRTGPRK